MLCPVARGHRQSSLRVDLEHQAVARIGDEEIAGGIDGEGGYRSDRRGLRGQRGGLGKTNWVPATVVIMLCANAGANGRSRPGTTSGRGGASAYGRV